MTRRGATTTQERILACLPFLVPLLNAYPFGTFLFVQVPLLGLLFSPIALLLPLYRIGGGGLAIVPFLIFIGLFVGVVRNTRIRHLIRYNAMQAILLGIALSLILALLELTGLLGRAAGGPAIDSGLFIILIFDVLFIGTIGIVGYLVVQTLRGHHGEVPVISDAAYAQTRD